MLVKVLRLILLYTICVSFSYHHNSSFHQYLRLHTPLPNIIITDDGFQNQQTTKDCVWEAAEDRVQVGVDVAASSPDDVKALIRKVRRAVEQYVGTLYTQGEDIPELESLSSDGLAWDWMKPCYYQRLTYQCITNANIEDEQEDN